MFDEMADRLLERYLAGDCTLSERSEVERWLAADPARAEHLARLVAAWQEAGPMAASTGHPDVGAAWVKVQGRVRSIDRPRLHIAAASLDEKPSQGPVLRRWALKVAAALVLAVGGTLAFLERANDSAVARSLTLLPMREVVTRRGQRTALELPDGSRVTLGAESRLRIPAGYRPSAGPREVFVDGEAYFEVQHDSLRPFLVHAANGIAEDLGTEFVVTAYPEMHGLRVVVASGRVALRSATADRKRSVTLRRGQLGRLDSLGVTTLTHEVDLAPYVAWVTGELVFDGSYMRDVVPRLARWYDLDIHLADSGIAERRLTIAFREESAREALNAIALSLGLQVEQNGRYVMLRRARGLQSLDQHLPGSRP